MENQHKSWSRRKLDHVNLALQFSESPYKAGFDDIRLLHCALPELSIDQIDITAEFMGRKLTAPLLINALTGGAEELTPFNKTLARVAARTGIAMAVGSQSIALKNNKLARTFAIVRENNPEGVILANVGAGIKCADALRAIEMIDADALQVHLNIPQELIMAEGDRNFQNYLQNIVEIVTAVKVPVIVKEVGFGISREVARTLLANGVVNFDIGGLGGTNFIVIENRRNKDECAAYFEEWGIPTVCSLVEVAGLHVPGQIVATGGIRNPLDAAKALALGADMVGVAGAFIRIIKKGTENNLVDYINGFKENLKKILLMSGAGNLKQLRQKPLLITGFCREWLEQRGISTCVFAQR